MTPFTQDLKDRVLNAYVRCAVYSGLGCNPDSPTTLYATWVAQIIWAAWRAWAGFHPGI